MEVVNEDVTVVYQQFEHGCVQLFAGLRGEGFRGHRIIEIKSSPAVDFWANEQPPTVFPYQIFCSCYDGVSILAFDLERPVMRTHSERLAGLSLKAAIFKSDISAGDTNFAGVVQQPERGLAKAETTVRLRSPAPLRERSSPAERSFDMREAERAALRLRRIANRK